MGHRFIGTVVGISLIACFAKASGNLKIAYFGDSTTAGTRIVGYPEDLSKTCIYTQPTESGPAWKIAISPVAEYIKERTSAAGLIKNYGINGQLATDLATTGLADFEAKLSEDHYAMVILNFGINDARYGKSKKSYVESMKVLVDAARRKGMYVIIEKPNPIIECQSWVNGPDSPADLLESYRSEIQSLAGLNVAFVDHGVWKINPHWRSLMADPLHPTDNGYRDKALRVANKINSLEYWCGLSVDRNTVGAKDNFTFLLSHNLSGQYQAYWYGTRNGVVDLNGQLIGGAGNSGQMVLGTYTNQAGWEGTYTRHVQIQDANGAVVCKTSPVTVQILSQKPTECTLSVSPAVVPLGGTFTFYFSGPKGDYGWYGNGADGSDQVHVPATATYINLPGWAGHYVRSLKNSNCTTNDVHVVLEK